MFDNSYQSSYHSAYLQSNCIIFSLPPRVSERSRAAAGKSGIMSRLFGTTDPDIVRDQTTRALDGKIVADKDAIEKAKLDLE